jgi:hypothetical protein
MFFMQKYGFWGQSSRFEIIVLVKSVTLFLDFESTKQRKRSAKTTKK